MSIKNDKSTKGLNNVDFLVNDRSENDEYTIEQSLKEQVAHKSEKANFLEWEGKKFEDYADFETVNKIIEDKESGAKSQTESDIDPNENSDYRDEKSAKISREQEKTSTHQQPNPEKAETLYESLKKEISSIRSNLTDIFVTNRKERSLHKEVGGVEVDYQKIKKQNDMDKDLWDMDQQVVDDMESSFESSQYESFVHKKKKGRGKYGKRMGQMRLSDDKENIKMGHVKRLQKMRMTNDHGHDNDGGISM